MNATAFKSQPKTSCCAHSFEMSVSQTMRSTDIKLHTQSILFYSGNFHETRILYTTNQKLT